jgi:hypothetical protein
MKEFLAHAPDREGEPELRSNVVPRPYFEDAYCLHVPCTPEVMFVDLEHPRTHTLLQDVIGDALKLFGIEEIDRDLAQTRDRRVTRFVLRTLYDICRSEEYSHVAGLRYASPDKSWDAYVVWNEPERLDLDAEDVTVWPILPWDDHLVAAMRTLGIDGYA